MAKAKTETVFIKDIVEELKESFQETMRGCFISPNVADSVNNIGNHQ